MSRFNEKVQNKAKTVNRAGGEAYKQSSKLQIVSKLLTSMLKQQYYSDVKEQMDDFKSLIKEEKDKKFVAKASIFARNEIGMRTITHVAAGEIANQVKGQDWTRRFFNKVVYRVDDITEILSYYMSNYGKPIPNSLKRGLGDAFGRFDRYQLAKYRSEGKDVSLVDAVNLVHPKPTTKNADALNELVNGTLKSVDTWESKLTKAGTSENVKEAKAEAWASLLNENKLGIFAALRNLRNIMTQAPEALDKALDVITNRHMISRSLILPYRYMTAYNEIEKIDGANARKTLRALNQAIDIACETNVPHFNGNTLVVADFSGSMGSTISDPKGQASLLGAILAKSNNADFMIFGDRAKYIQFNPDDSTLTLTNSFLKLNRGWAGSLVGHGTNFNSIFETANRSYDRVIILSDMQAWKGYYTPTTSFQNYKTKYDCNPYIYSFDLVGHGDMQFPEDKVICLAGFSEKLFGLMQLAETDKKVLLNKIEAIEF